MLAVGIVLGLSIGLYYLFFQNQIKVAADNDRSFQEQHKAPNPALISTIAYDLPQKQQNKNSFQSPKQGGSPKISQARPVRDEHEDGISQKSEPQAIRQPQQNQKSEPQVIRQPQQNQKSEPQVIRQPQQSQKSEFLAIRQPQQNQKSEPRAIQHPQQNMKESVFDEPIKEASRPNGSSGPQNVPNPDGINLKIIEAAACSSVKDRTPQEPGNSFDWSMDKIFIWTRIQCDRLPSSIRHIYYCKGQKVNDISLNIRSSHWRTWSYKTLSNKRYIGPWRVDIASNDGKLLQTINFEIN